MDYRYRSSSYGPRDYRADYQERPHYRSSSQPPRSSGYYDYGDYDSPRRRAQYRDYRDDSPRRRTRYSDYQEDFRHSNGYGLQPAGYSRDHYDRPVKEYYQPRNTYNYLPSQYNTNGHYTDYVPTRRSGAPPRYGSQQYDNNWTKVPYTSPMGYKTVSDRRRYNCWDSHRYDGTRAYSTYSMPRAREARPELDYGYRARRHAGRHQGAASDYYNPSYSEHVSRERVPRRVAWEDLSTNALNYRDNRYELAGLLI
jgi:hypothetical protein